MLFIIYGGTLELGFISREYFKKCGFESVTKFNHVTESSEIDSSMYKSPSGIYKDWFGDKRYVSRAEIEKLDFRYEHSGIMLGFDKTQIISAVHGACDSVITLSASSIDFIRQIKKAYGDYVTVICLQTSTETVRELLAGQPGISEKELDSRFKGHILTQQVYLENLELFDFNVIYEQAPSLFDTEALYKQYGHIIEKRRVLERQLNNRKYVELPYTGKEPYVFVSYKHEDKDRVYPVLAMLQRNCVRLWYDDGIEGGRNWKKIISQKLEESSLFLLFSSKLSVSSENVLDEVSAAFDSLKKNCITIRLDDAKFDLITQERINRHQIISNTDDPMFETKLIGAINSRTPEVIGK